MANNYLDFLGKGKVVLLSLDGAFLEEIVGMLFVFGVLD